MKNKKKLTLCDKCVKETDKLFELKNKWYCDNCYDEQITIEKNKWWNFGPNGLNANKSLFLHGIIISIWIFLGIVNYSSGYIRLPAPTYFMLVATLGLFAIGIYLKDRMSEIQDKIIKKAMGIIHDIIERAEKNKK